MTTLDTVKEDVCRFLDENDKLLFNERDLQMNLAIYLKERGHYDRVEVEYYIPTEMLPDYKKLDPKNDRLYLDIVVVKDGMYVPIELKYKTKETDLKIERFGELCTEASDDTEKDVLKNQGAQNLGRYNFWKDVKRIELVKQKFDAVLGGVAVFVTNDTLYLKPPTKRSSNILFSMADGKQLMQKHWRKADSKLAKKYPNFEVEKEYSIQWRKKDVSPNVQLHYCTLII